MHQCTTNLLVFVTLRLKDDFELVLVFVLTAFGQLLRSACSPSLTATSRSTEAFNLREHASRHLKTQLLLLTDIPRSTQYFTAPEVA